jgi:heparan-alpha-glucosaminide N-acetyltransferase
MAMGVTSAPRAAPANSNDRLVSLDVYRGMVMLLLVFFDAPNGWTSAVSNAHGEGTWQRAVARQFEHVEWQGLTLWDMVQPSFMFVVGVAVAFSYAARARRGDSFWRMFGHAAWRALVLVLLGVFLRSAGYRETRWTFEDVVTQIGPGYVFLFLLWNRGWQIQLAAVAVILIGYWALFAAWPLPGPSYDYHAVEGQVYYEGFQAHWNKNAHPAHYFDQWLLNLFPRSEPFVANGGGYNTLNFVPSLATMILGLMAGELLRGERASHRKLMMLVLAGIVCVGIGAALHFGGACPMVKRIWTPSFALVSGGICLLTLAAFYAIVDMAGWRRWALPAIIVGMNPIAAYVMIHLAAEWIVETLQRHFGTRPFSALGGEFQPMLENWSVGLCVWLVCFWMYRRRIFLRL